MNEQPETQKDPPKTVEAPSQSEVTTEADRVAIHAASAPTIRLPPFWPKKVKLWFSQVEAQFLVSKVIKDEQKFSFVVAQLDAKYAEEIEDIICDPPVTGKYATLKAELIKRLSDSDSTRVRKLLETEQIGDRSPTQFWRRLKDLAGTAVSNDFLLELWKGRLPVQTQHILAATSETDGAKLAEIADRINELPRERGHTIATINPPWHNAQSAAPNDLRTEMREVLEGVRQILQVTRDQEQQNSRRSRNKFRSRSNPPGRSNSRRRDEDRRTRSNSRSRANGLCWYHDKYGVAAEKCRTPCSWKPSENSQGHL